MKKLVASVGLAALGASAFQQTASAQALGTPDNSKPWSISATLRGFYDSNPSTVNDGFVVPAGMHKESFGFEVSPAAALAWALDQTTISLAYVYSYKYYEHTPVFSTGHSDNAHTFNATLTHAFSERAKMRVSDSFVVGQEPDLLRAGNAFSTFQRVSGDNIRNYGSISLDAQMTPTFGIGVGYDNALYNYADDKPILSGTGAVISPSNAGILDRIENTFHIEGLWNVAPESKLLLGYRFKQTGFTGDQAIGTITGPTGNVLGSIMSDSRDSRVHTVYAGVEHNFRPDLTGSLRAGANIADYNNDPSVSTSVTPYVDASLRYTYAPESFVEGGFHYDRNATDVVGFLSTGSYTLDSEAAVVYASLTHRITPNIFGNLIAQFQNDTFKGGRYDSQDENYYLVGLNLEYRFNRYVSAHVGYNYDNLNSNIGRTFDRNRVYIGVTASY